MANEIITTSVDALIALLKTVKNIKIEQAAAELKLPITVIQSWVDFLVEENIIGIEYKFTTPYIYLNKEKIEQDAIRNEEKTTMQMMKEDFQEKAEQKNIPKIETVDLWKNHLLEKVERKKQFFFQEARKRGFFNTEELWKEYKEDLMKI